MGLVQEYLFENRLLYDDKILCHQHGLNGLRIFALPLMSQLRLKIQVYDGNCYRNIARAPLEMAIFHLSTYGLELSADYKWLLHNQNCTYRSFCNWLRLFLTIGEANRIYSKNNSNYFNYLWYVLPYFCFQQPVSLRAYEPKNLLPDSIYHICDTIVSNIVYNQKQYASDIQLTNYFTAICKYFESDLIEKTNMCIHEIFYYLQKIGIIFINTRVYDIPNLDVSFKKDLYNNLIRILPSI